MLWRFSGKGGVGHSGMGTVALVVSIYPDKLCKYFLIGIFDGFLFDTHRTNTIEFLFDFLGSN